MNVFLKKIAVFMAMLCCVIGGGCNSKKSNDAFTFYTPDGAPAMAFAELMSQDTASDEVEYFVVNPSTIATKVTSENQDKNADFCVLPVTAVSKLLGDKQTYQVLSVVTGGNLYVLSKDQALVSAFEGTEYKDISYLLGKTVGVMKINDMPGLTFKWILNNYELPWKELKDGEKVEADKVNLKGIVDATEINPLDTGIACYVVAEPAASVQIQKKNFISVCSLERLYYKGAIVMDCTGESFIGYPQAVLVAKRSVIENNQKFIAKFLEKVESSVNWCYTDKATGEKIVSAVKEHLEDTGYATTLKAEVLTWEVLRRCGVLFAKGEKCETAVRTYLRYMATVDNKINSLEETFFY